MPLENFDAGSRVFAAGLDAMQPLTVIKAVDESVTSSTTLQADNALFLPVLAAATYIFECFLDYEGGTQGASDIKWAWTVPSGALLRYTGTWIGTGGGVELGLSNELSLAATNNTAGTDGAGVLFGICMTGTLIVSATAGTLQLEWAQNTSSATPTIVHANSSLMLVRNS